MGNLFASTGLGDEKPHERDVEYCGFADRRPYERQNENPETTAVHTCIVSVVRSISTLCLRSSRRCADCVVVVVVAAAAAAAVILQSLQGAGLTANNKCKWLLGRTVHAGRWLRLRSRLPSAGPRISSENC